MESARLPWTFTDRADPCSWAARTLKYPALDESAAIEFGRIMAARGEAGSAPGGNLTTWLRGVRPSAYLFIAARVVNRTDLDATVDFARTAAQVMDGVGLFCFGPDGSRPDRYVKYAVPTDLSLDRVLYRACQDLLALKDRSTDPLREPPPAQETERGPEHLDGDP